MQVNEEPLVFYEIYLFTQLILKFFVYIYEILLGYQVFEVAQSLVWAKLEPLCDFAANIKYENIWWYLDMKMECLRDFGGGHLLDGFLANGDAVQFDDKELLLDPRMFANLLDQALHRILFVGLNDKSWTPELVWVMNAVED